MLAISVNAWYRYLWNGERCIERYSVINMKYIMIYKLVFYILLDDHDRWIIRFVDSSVLLMSWI